MSTTIDNRVLEMKFDNASFEKNISTSMSTLTKLNKSLTATESAKGFANAFKNIDISGFGNSVDMLKGKFTALQIAGITAIANITNSAVNFGKRIAKALTIDPIKSGFQEYETQLNSVQTILANTESKGETLDTVKNALAELNTYADKTIYNFTEMARNIGTFTAAGVDLKVSVSAIKGIANLAAVSGSTSQQASTAMYQLSQALASGTVKLMDWNSVVNAGMGGQVFQDSLKETARLHGVSIDSMIKKEGSFRETLQNGWLSSEILTETLSKFTGDLNAEQLKSMGYNEDQIKSILKLGKTASEAATKVKTFTQLFDTLKEAATSGWARTWEIIVGDFGEAKESLTQMSDLFGGIIGSAADNRNATLMGGLSTGWTQLMKQGIDDTAGYQDMIKEVANDYGVNLDSMINDNVSFQDALKQTLKDGRLTSSTLITALQKLTDKTAGMSDEQLEELGYTRQQVDALEKLNTEVKNGTVVMSDYTNKMMISSGRENLIEALKNSFFGLMDILKPVGEAFREVFPPMTAEQLYKITENIRDLTAKFKLGLKDTDNLRKTFKGLFAAIDIVGMAFKAIGKAILPMFNGFKDTSSGILEMTGSFGEWIYQLDQTIKKTDSFTTAINMVVDTIKNGFSKAKEGVSSFLDNFKLIGEIISGKIDISPMELFYAIIGRIQDRLAHTKENVGAFKDGIIDAFRAISDSPAFQGFIDFVDGVLNKIGDGFVKLGETLKPVGKWIAQAAENFASSFVKIVGNSDFNTLFDIINGGGITALIVMIIKFVKSITSVTDGIADTIDGATSMKKTVTDSINAIKGAVLNTFTAFQEKLKADILIKIAIAIGILAVALLVLSFIDSKKLAVSLGIITGLFIDLMGAMAIFGKVAGTDLKGMNTLVIGMLGLAVVLAILVGVITKLSKLNVEQLAVGLGGLTGMVVVIISTMAIMSKMKSIDTDIIIQMAAVVLVLKILATVVNDLAKLDPKQLASGLIGIGILLTELSLFMQAAEFGDMGVETGIGLIALAIGLNLMAKAVKSLGELGTGAMIQGLVGLSAILYELQFFQESTSAGDMISTAIGMTILGGALIILSKAVSIFGTMPLEVIAKGVAAMAGIMIVLQTAMNRMPKHMIAIGIGLVIVGAALNIMAGALMTMGNMSWEQIGKGLTVLSVALAAVAISVRAMSGSLAGAFAMLVVSAALALMVPSLLVLSALSWTAIITGMAALAGVFLVLGVAGAVLTPLIIPILALAAAFTLIGVGIMATGAGLLMMGMGLTALAAGFATLATLGAAGAVAVVNALKIIVVGVATLIPMVMTKIAEGIGEFAKVIIANAPIILQAVITVISSIVTGLVATIPMVVEGLYILLTTVLQTMVTYAPQIIEAVLTLLTILLEQFALALPDLIQAGADLITAFITGVANTSEQIIQAAFDAMITFINGLSDCIDRNTPTMITAIDKLFDSIIAAAILVLTNSIVKMRERGKAIIDGIKSGINDKVEDVKSAVKDIVSGAVSAVEEKIEAFKTAGGNIIAGLINGIKDKFEDARKTASELGSKILQSAKDALGIESPSKEFAEVGRWSVLGLVNGLTQYASKVYGTATDVANGTVEAMKNSFNGISNIITDNMDLSPVIKPTLDLTNITNGAKSISSMFNNQKLGVTGETGETVQNDGTGTLGNNINYTQNIYSPKAVSRTEIYRQTKNLFATSKGLVNGV